MRVLLVTSTEKLVEKMTILNPKLKYCALVVNDVEAAKEILAKVISSTKQIYPMEMLNEYLERLNYDYVVCVEDKWWKFTLAKKVEACAVSGDKILNFCNLPWATNFLLERSLRYFKEHATEFEIFATGISTVEKGIDPAKFKRKLFNFGRGSQDLYYNFQVAKFAVACSANKLRYALIGLAPYSFHYDLSSTVKFKYMMLQYFIAFKDLHNFFVPVEVYENFFRKEYLATQVSLKGFNVNVPYGANSKLVKAMINPLDSLSGIHTWEGKYYPKTRNENIKILDDYLRLCEENNIRPIMFRVPVTEKYIQSFNKQLLEEFDTLVAQACQKYSSAIFVDSWKWSGLTYADFHDHEHLNTHGAAKFSAYLNEFIEHLDNGD